MGPPARGLPTAVLPGAEERSDEACRTPEQLRPSERAPRNGDRHCSADAEAERPGVGEVKGGESRRSRERGERGGEWRRNGAKELAQRAKRKERALSAVEGGEADRVCRQPSEARALLKRRRAGQRRASEFRGAQATRHASPSTGESRERALRRQRACRQSAVSQAVWRQ